MLSNLDSHTMIAATDLDRARQFYQDKLGMTRVEAAHGAWFFTGPNGSRVFLFKSPFAGSAKNAVMGWVTADIEEEVSHLKSRGVVFEEYDAPNFKTVNGVVAGSSGKSAWFKDSEGNMLGLVQWG